MIRYHTTLGKLCQIVMCWCLFVLACAPTGDQTDGLSGYYLPLDDFPEDGMVYTYRNLQDTGAEAEVWRHLKKGEGLIESINYGTGQEVVQRQFDRIVSNGVITDSLLLYSPDSTGARKPIRVKIVSPHRFPYEPGDSTKVWLTQLEWNQPEDSLHILLQRRRRYIGATTWEMNGKVLPAVRFRTEDTFETERDGWTSSTWTGEEIYAKHIGLVYYKRKISDELILEFELEGTGSGKREIEK